MSTGDAVVRKLVTFGRILRQGGVERPKRLTLGYFRQDFADWRDRSVLAETIAVTELYILHTRDYHGPVRMLNRVCSIVVGLYDAGKLEIYGFGKGPGGAPPIAHPWPAGWHAVPRRIPSWQT